MIIKPFWFSASLKSKLFHGGSFPLQVQSLHDYSSLQTHNYIKVVWIRSSELVKYRIGLWVTEIDVFHNLFQCRIIMIIKSFWFSASLKSKLFHGGSFPLQVQSLHDYSSLQTHNYIKVVWIRSSELVKYRIGLWVTEIDVFHNLFQCRIIMIIKSFWFSASLKSKLFHGGSFPLQVQSLHGYSSLQTRILK